MDKKTVKRGGDEREYRERKREEERGGRGIFLGVAEVWKGWREARPPGESSLHFPGSVAVVSREEEEEEEEE